MRERAAAVDIAERPDALGFRAKLAVHIDQAVLVQHDARLVQPEVIRIRRASGREQQMRGIDALLIFQHDPNALARRFDLRRRRVEQKLHPLPRHDLLNLFSEVLVLTRQHTITSDKHAHAAAETPEHLREFQRDIAPADNRQMLWQFGQFEHGGIRKM